MISIMIVVHIMDQQKGSGAHLRGFVTCVVIKRYPIYPTPDEELELRTGTVAPRAAAAAAGSLLYKLPMAVRRQRIAYLLLLLLLRAASCFCCFLLVTSYCLLALGSRVVCGLGGSRLGSRLGSNLGSTYEPHLANQLTVCSPNLPP